MRLGAGMCDVMLCYFIAFIWLKSTVAHLSNPYAFLSSILKYDLLNLRMAIAFAMIVPFLQLAFSVCLAARVFVRESLIGSFGLFAVFGCAQALALAKGLRIGCGCFGSDDSHVIDASSILLVSFLCCLSLFALFIHAQRERKRAL